MRSSLFVVAALACIALAVYAAHDDFDRWVQKHGKTYANDVEYQHRREIFHQNRLLVHKMNSLKDGARYELNLFADMTPDEHKGMYRGWAVPEAMKSAPQGSFKVSADPTPTSWDWRTKGAVTEVKNQGQCGSCWSFSTTGNVEGQWFLAGHTLTPLSEQQFVDCDKVDQGCNGGLPSNAFEYAIKAGGIESEASYPYTAMDGSCQFSASKVVAKISNWTAVSTDEDTIASVLVSTGPLSIGINAEWMQFYAGGVSDPLFCNPKALDHGVLIVGFGTQDSKPYWIIKNSWGPTWGEKGYYLIIRGKGKCGLNTMVTTSIV
jgi:cathepsin F